MSISRVINIGDDTTFVKLARERLPDLPVESEALTGSLFSTINDTDSNINMLIGAKKFVEGWNSWRVSSMGLLNVGRSEGSEIVQMFGRGVRLKGLDFSLKRSSALPPPHPSYITALETLNIFSINGDYLRDFRKALEREGIVEYTDFEVPLQYGLFEAEQPSLFSLRVEPTFEFGRQPAFQVTSIDDRGVIPVIDLRPRLQAVSSHRNEGPATVEAQAIYFEPWVLDLLDWDKLYAEMLAWKRQRGIPQPAGQPGDPAQGPGRAALHPLRARFRRPARELCRCDPRAGHGPHDPEEVRGALLHAGAQAHRDVAPGV